MNYILNLSVVYCVSLDGSNTNSIQVRVCVGRGAVYMKRTKPKTRMMMVMRWDMLPEKGGRKSVCEMSVGR